MKKLLHFIRADWVLIVGVICYASAIVIIVQLAMTFYVVFVLWELFEAFIKIQALK